MKEKPRPTDDVPELLHEIQSVKIGYTTIPKLRKSRRRLDGRFPITEKHVAPKVMQHNRGGSLDIMKKIQKPHYMRT